MFVHSVYFWLDRELSGEQRAAFREGLESLRSILSVEQLYIGTPADTNRPVIDRSYDFNLVVVVRDKAAHDAYQVDPLHKKFLDTFAPMWERLLIYDAD